MVFYWQLFLCINETFSYNIDYTFIWPLNRHKPFTDAFVQEKICIYVHKDIKIKVPVATKKYFESPWIPIVPGPTISAKTLIIENAPHIIP